MAAHYGSVSAGTFAVVVAFLVSRQISFESYMPLFVAILEIPAILVGILLARGVSRGTDWKELGREIFLGKSIMLLLGGLVIGAVAGKEAIKPLEPLYTSMFEAGAGVLPAGDGPDRLQPARRAPAVRPAPGGVCPAHAAAGRAGRRPAGALHGPEPGWHGDARHPGRLGVLHRRAGGAAPGLPRPTRRCR